MSYFKITDMPNDFSRNPAGILFKKYIYIMLYIIKILCEKNLPGICINKNHIQKLIIIRYYINPTIPTFASLPGMNH